jgi:uncharacterized membrane-anchored protein
MIPAARNIPSIDGHLGRIPLPVRTGVACLVLCGLILLMVTERASVLRGGTEVRLATQPVDPRDLFRGDYVILRYDISEVNLTRAGATQDPNRNEAVFVGLRAGADGRAEAVKVARAGEPREPGLIWIEGKTRFVTNCTVRANAPDAQRRCAANDRMLHVVYGLESYFVPQGEGRAIETTPASRVEVVAAVAANGRSAIKRLLIDGKPVYDEPPY